MKIERITDLERQYAIQSLDGQFETHNNYKFVVRLEKAFAEKIGKSVNFLGQIEGTGTIRGVSLETLFKIADVLGIPPSKLLEDD